MGLHYKQTRFAVELLVLHDQNTKDNVTLSTEKSIDDEYTPSVFEVITSFRREVKGDLSVVQRFCNQKIRFSSLT